MSGINSREKIDWFFVAATLSSYTLGFIFANRVNKTVPYLVTLAGMILILFFYLINWLISQLSTEPFAGRMGAPGRIYQRNNILYGTIFVLSFVGVGAVYVLLKYHSLQGQAMIWLLGLIFCQFLLLSKPISYTTTPYHWLLKSLIIAPFGLFFGCTLQGFFPSPAMINLGISVFLGAGSALIVLMFKEYASDLNRKRRSFLITVTWEKGLLLHHFLYVASLTSLILFAIISRGTNIYWPAIAWQVFGLYEIYLLEQLARGIRPNYPLMDALAIFRVLGTLYLLIYALLIH